MKKILFLFLLLIMPVTVFAATEISQSDFQSAKSNPGTAVNGITYTNNNDCFNLAGGEYKLTENISFDSYDHICLTDGDVTLDLNEKILTGRNYEDVIEARGVNVIITGNGTITGREDYTSFAISVRGGNLTIESGTFDYGVAVKALNGVLGSVVINGGTFKDQVDVDSSKTAIINGGTFNSMAYLHVDNSIIINGGVFESEDAVMDAKASNVIINGGTFDGIVGAFIAESENVEINGGTFAGSLAGLFIDMDLYEFDEQADDFVIVGTSNIKINGGKFSVDDGGFGSIAIQSERELDENILYQILSEGSSYDKELNIDSGESVFEDEKTMYMIKNNVEVITSKGEYTLISGANQTYTLGSGKTLIFEASIPFSEFTASGSVYIDGKELDSKNYTATEGSTIITLKSAYLDTLKVGSHTIVISTDLGEVEASFKVVEEEKKNNNPATGDNITMYALLTLVSIAGLITIRKCKKN